MTSLSETRFSRPQNNVALGLDLCFSRILMFSRQNVEKSIIEWIHLGIPPQKFNKKEHLLANVNKSMNIQSLLIEIIGKTNHA